MVFPWLHFGYWRSSNSRPCRIFLWWLLLHEQWCWWCCRLLFSLSPKISSMEQSTFPKGWTFIQKPPNWSFLFGHYKNRIASLSCSLTKTLWNILSPSAVMQYLPFLKRNKIPPRLFSKSGSFCSFFLRDVFLYFASASKITSNLSVFFHVSRGLVWGFFYNLCWLFFYFSFW